MQKLFSRYTEKENRALSKKSRDSLSIILDILKVAESGATKTKIINSASLSFAPTNKYLNLMDDLGFLECYRENWQLTDKGRDFLKQWKKFDEFYNEVRILFKTLRSERQQLIQNCYSNQTPPISQITNMEEYYNPKNKDKKQHITSSAMLTRASRMRKRRKPVRSLAAFEADTK